MIAKNLIWQLSTLKKRQFKSTAIACEAIGAADAFQGYRVSFRGTVIGNTQPLPKDGARNALFSNLSKSGLDNYVVKRSKRHLLEEVS